MGSEYDIRTGSKTFLVGEYSVLFGGGAVVLVTAPYFRLKIRSGKTNLVGVEEQSPAYRFYKTHDFNGLSIDFCDPHNKSGGFGASSAQFSLLYQLYLRLTRKEFDAKSFLAEYKQLSSKTKGVAPSGADCVAQYFNYSIYFNGADGSAEKINRNFPNLDFAIFSTGYKVATHLHLQELKAFNIEKFQKAVLGVRKSFADGNEEALVENVRNFSDLLAENNFVCDNSLGIVEKLLKTEGVRAAKGCGALGADTVLVIFEKSKIPDESVLREIVSGATAG
ncbi:MAG: hypothetical protein LBJ96_04960 [Holosporaceae bacterium]|jgi:mevalonate kinase|nr:hypothetical protein [Holosporaceae bacterium]